MRNVVHSIFLSIIIFLFFEDVLTFSFHRRPSTHSNSQTARRVNWSDDSSVIRDNLPRITHDLVHQLVRK